MTRKIRLDQIGSFSTEKYEQLLRATVLQTELRLKMASPVDTGRFRGSWITSENQAASYDAGPYQEATGKYKNQTKPPREPALETRIAYGYAVGQERVGNVYHISNNLPYAEALANGHSKQAPAGWTELIAREMQEWVKRTADAIGRQD